MNSRITSSIILAVFLIVPFVASAQSSNSSKTEKLFLNIHLNANGLNLEDYDATGGGGLGIKAGYGFSQLFTLYLGIDGAQLGENNFTGISNNQSVDYGLGLIELGGQFNFYTSKPAAIPYAEVALTAQGAVADPQQGSNITITGGGISLGGGLKYFVSTTLALDLGVSFTFGNFDKIEIGNQTSDFDQNSVATRLNLGVSWFPFN